MIDQLTRIRSHARRQAVSAALSALVLAGRFYTFLSRAQPRRMILPALIAQFVLFLVSLGFEARGLYIFAAGTFLLAALVIFSTTLPRPRCHWVQ